MDHMDHMSHSMESMSSMDSGMPSSTSMANMPGMSHGSGGNGGDGFCSGGGTVMQMGFQSSIDGSCLLFLFPGAVVDTEGKYAAAVIGVFFMAFFNEGLRWARARAAAHQAPFTFMGKLPLAAKEAVMAIGFGCQMVMAYWIMLLVMLYESVVFTAIILGLMFGYFTFNYIEARNAARAAAAAATDKSIAASSSTPSDDGLGKAEAPIATLISSGTPCCDPAA